MKTRRRRAAQTGRLLLIQAIRDCVGLPPRMPASKGYFTRRELMQVLSYMQTQAMKAEQASASDASN